MRVAYSIHPSTLANPGSGTVHQAGRFTDNAGRERTAERTMCGIVLGLGWRVAEMETEPTCERCREFAELGREQERAA